MTIENTILETKSMRHVSGATPLPPQKKTKTKTKNNLLLQKQAQQHINLTTVLSSSRATKMWIRGKKEQIDGRKDERTNGQKVGRKDGWRDGRIDKCWDEQTVGPC